MIDKWFKDKFQALSNGLDCFSSEINRHLKQHCLIQEKPGYNCALSIQQRYLPQAPYASITKSNKQTNRQQNKKSRQGDEEGELFLISEVELRGAEGQIRDIAQGALTLRPNFGHTLADVQQGVDQLFQCGYFSEVTPSAEDTKDGLKVIYTVKVNHEVRGVVTRGASVLPTGVLCTALKPLYGNIMNVNKVKDAINHINAWYEQKGIMGQVTNINEEQGMLDIQIQEFKVGAINLRYVDSDTEEPKQHGATKEQIISRHLTTKPGSVYNLHLANQDVDSIYSMGLFENVNITPRQAESSTVDDPKLDLTLTLPERSVSGFTGGMGFSGQNFGEGHSPGPVGSFSYNHRNLFGCNQRLSLSAELGQKDRLFGVHYSDPWMSSGPRRTSRSVSLQNSRVNAGAILGQTTDPVGPNATAQLEKESGQFTIARLQGGVEFGQPLSQKWNGVFGVNWSRVSCLGQSNGPIVQDEYGSPVTFSGRQHDVALVLAARAASSATEKQQVAVSVEQSVPMVRFHDWLSFTRIRGRIKRQVRLGALTLQAQARSGAIFRDLPPYEAFPIGGAGTVRGYGEGGVGTARYFAVGSVELHYPTGLKGLQGVWFADYGSDLNSGVTVVGDPAGVRNKPGSGYGYGGGVLADTPLGPLRFEYGRNDRGTGRFHLGFGVDV